MQNRLKFYYNSVSFPLWMCNSICSRTKSLNLFTIARLYARSLLAFDSRSHIIACNLKQGFRFIWGGWFKVWDYTEHSYLIHKVNRLNKNVSMYAYMLNDVLGCMILMCKIAQWIRHWSFVGSSSFCCILDMLSFLNIKQSFSLHVEVDIKV